MIKTVEEWMDASADEQHEAYFHLLDHLSAQLGAKNKELEVVRSERDEARVDAHTWEYAANQYKKEIDKLWKALLTIQNGIWDGQWAAGVARDALSGEGTT
jgi:chromosome segregation ATPase